METIESVIGGGRELELQFASANGQGIAEYWVAELSDVTEPDNSGQEPAYTLVARAQIVRVDLNNDEWWYSLDAESGDLMLVGDAFRDFSVITELDEESAFSSSLVVLDRVFVPEEHRGNQASHALVRGVAAIFRNDLIALTPESMTIDESGKQQRDEVKAAGLAHHWEAMGFIRVPEHDVWILPYVNR